MDDFHGNRTAEQCNPPWLVRSIIDSGTPAKMTNAQVVPLAMTILMHGRDAGVKNRKKGKERKRKETKMNGNDDPSG